jgi:hypothetical protein
MIEVPTPTNSPEYEGYLYYSPRRRARNEVHSPVIYALNRFSHRQIDVQNTERTGNLGKLAQYSQFLPRNGRNPVHAGPEGTNVLWQLPPALDMRSGVLRAAEHILRELDWDAIPAYIQHTAYQQGRANCTGQSRDDSQTLRGRSVEPISDRPTGQLLIIPYFTRTTHFGNLESTKK